MGHPYQLGSFANLVTEISHDDLQAYISSHLDSRLISRRVKKYKQIYFHLFTDSHVEGAIWFPSDSFYSKRDEEVIHFFGYFPTEGNSPVSGGKHKKYHSLSQVSMWFLGWPI